MAERRQSVAAIRVGLGMVRPQRNRTSYQVGRRRGMTQLHFQDAIEMQAVSMSRAGAQQRLACRRRLGEAAGLMRGDCGAEHFVRRE